jgi:hypothetical protein
MHVTKAAQTARVIQFFMVEAFKCQKHQYGGMWSVWALAQTLNKPLSWLGGWVQTVAIGVAGEPIAPGKRKGGAVSKNRERWC